MVRALIVLFSSSFVLVFSAGCAVIQESPLWPAYERPFCYPKASYKHDQRRYYGGVSCRF